MRTARPYRLLSSQTAGTAASRCLAASSTTTCHRSKREKASDIDELVRKHCCKMPSPNDPTAHRGGHMICFMWSAECGYEELAECLDHFCYRLGSGSARHALLTTSLPHALPSSSQRCRLAQQPRCLRYTSFAHALSFLDAVFKSAQRRGPVVHFSWCEARAQPRSDARCTTRADGRVAGSTRRVCYGFDSRPCATSLRDGALEIAF
jgi:hypothetical protein